MNPRAAQELLDMVMIEDRIARLDAMDTWSRRWIATMHLEQTFDPNILRASPEDRQNFYRHAVDSLRREMLNGLAKDEVHALLWGKLADNPNSLVLQMHVILQEPRELNAGADAAKAMMDMARGDK